MYKRNKDHTTLLLLLRRSSVSTPEITTLDEVSNDALREIRCNDESNTGASAKTCSARVAVIYINVELGVGDLILLKGEKWSWRTCGTHARETNTDSETPDSEYFCDSEKWS